MSEETKQYTVLISKALKDRDYLKIKKLLRNPDAAQWALPMGRVSRILDLADYTKKHYIDNGTEDDLIASAYLSKKQEARKRGLEFTLTLADLRRIVRRKTCYYTGITLVNGDFNNKPTFERKDNAVGYTKENTVLCAAVVNRLKNELFENPESDIKMSVGQVLKFITKLKTESHIDKDDSKE